LKVFQFYEERYREHEKARNVHMQQLENVDALLRAVIQLTGFTRLQITYIRTAFEQLVSNRSTIMYSYAFAYYRPHRLPQVNQHIFENLQHDLEMYTERLSHTIESKQAIYFVENDTMIKDQTLLAARVRAALLDASSAWGEMDARTGTMPMSVAAKSSAVPQRKNTGQQKFRRRAFDADVDDEDVPLPRAGTQTKVARTRAGRAPVLDTDQGDEGDADDSEADLSGDLGFDRARTFAPARAVMPAGRGGGRRAAQEANEEEEMRQAIAASLGNGVRTGAAASPLSATGEPNWDQMTPEEIELHLVMQASMSEK